MALVSRSSSRFGGHRRGRQLRSARSRLLLGVTVAFVVAKSMGSAAGAGVHASVHLRVTPAQSLMDTPLSISVSGLRPGQHTVLRVTSIDAHGVQWMGDATFVANAAGVVDPARMAPVAGATSSYHGVRPMGLIESMTGTNPAGYFPYSWGSSPRTFTISATQSGRHPVPVKVARSTAAPNVTSTAVTLASAGFVGELWQPAPRTARRPALVIIGGSGGGLAGTALAALLASRGYPTLGVAYFSAPGLPATLANIPLEYLARALRWLGTQPNVDPRQIYVLGASRGSEAALLLGAYFPNLVAGVIAGSPSNVAGCSFPTGCAAPAWTLNGEPLPFSSQAGNPAPTDNPAAVIPVERIHRPILLVCGGSDQVWDSCRSAQAMMTRLGANRDLQAHVLLSDPNAGHGITGLIAYQPGGYNSTGAVTPQSGDLTTGATSAANAIAVAQIWPKVLMFLAIPDRVRSS